jgi:hypothetical protein
MGSTPFCRLKNGDYKTWKTRIFLYFYIFPFVCMAFFDGLNDFNFREDINACPSPRFVARKTSAKTLATPAMPLYPGGYLWHL